jgi:hypothetical protein
LTAEAKEDAVSERARVVGATVAGAAIGGLVGYLFFTAGGRRLRGEIEPRLSEVSAEIARTRDTVMRAYAALSDARRLLDRREGERGPWPREPPSDQEVPFV